LHVVLLPAVRRPASGVVRTLSVDTVEARSNLRHWLSVRVCTYYLPFRVSQRGA